MTASSGYVKRPFKAVAIVLFVSVLATLAALNSQQVGAAWFDRAADRVVGQSDFTTKLSGATANKLSTPKGLAVDRSTGRLFVADWLNGRVQSWPQAASFGNGASADKSITSDGHGVLPLDPVATATDASANLYVADLSNNRVLVFPPPYSSSTAVIGQPNYSSYMDNQGSPSPTEHTLSGPLSVAVDGSNHLYVADRNNHRVLRYTLPITMNNQAADRVLGQADYGSNDPNRGNGTTTTTNDGLFNPQGVAVDSAGNVYVADTDNNRVVRYDVPLSNGKPASLVLGQANFTDNSENQGGSWPTAQTLHTPNGLAVDRYSRLYVADKGNTRVLGFDVRRPSNGAAAEIVIGQPDFGPVKYPPAAATEYSLAYPNAVAVDGGTNVYIADTYNNRVLGYDTPWPWNVQLPLLAKR